MKVNFNEHMKARVQELALSFVARSVSEIGTKILDDTPRPRRTRFFKKLKENRWSVFEAAGVTVPPEVNLFDKDQRYAFMKTLPVETRIQIHLQIAKHVAKIAADEGFDHIAELQKIKESHFQDVLLSSTEEDLKTLMQMARDNTDNVQRKHTAAVAAKSTRLSGAPADVSGAGAKPDKPKAG
jgi:hypothetical protein